MDKRVIEQYRKKNVFYFCPKCNVELLRDEKFANTKVMDSMQEHEFSYLIPGTWLYVCENCGWLVTVNDGIKEYGEIDLESLKEYIPGFRFSMDTDIGYHAHDYSFKMIIEDVIQIQIDEQGKVFDELLVVI